MKQSGYCLGIGAANVDIHGNSRNAIVLHDSNPGIMHISAGGVTRNVCENLARMGGKARLISALGSDTNAEIIRRSCEAVGIDLSDCYVSPNRSSTYMSILDEAGEMFVALSDMSVLQELTMEFLNTKRETIENAAVITMDPGSPAAVLEGVLDAYGDRIPVFVDPVSTAYAKRLKPFVGKVHTLKPNRLELEVLSGCSTDTQIGVQRACGVLLHAGVKRVFVSQGPDGSTYMDADGTIMHRKLRPLQRMENATGAGDAFMAALIYSYLTGLDAEETMGMGLAAGIAAISAAETINQNMSLALLEQIRKERK